MESKDLRIGNLIWYDPTNGLNMYLNKVDGEDIRLMEESEDYLALHKPIPLTEEWLLRMGFPEDGTFNSNTFFSVSRSNINDIDWCIYFNNESVGEYIKHVHQLQNLYFALTNSELTIKDK